jgi:hypothetical protein
MHEALFAGKDAEQATGKSRIIHRAGSQAGRQLTSRSRAAAIAPAIGTFLEGQLLMASDRSFTQRCVQAGTNSFCLLTGAYAGHDLS